MDRLICGDAGYGKTEVALRAAFKAVVGGKQVGLLVPTTVLAQQHFRTFRQRLAAFPVEVEILSRFRTKAEIATALAGLEDGSVDIAIGTHRLLQRDVRFKDLGLLIIDEEQRFGVTHKEALKRMRTEVDVLTLTATPIPRTLYLALTGARDISTINTPPEERLPVAMHVGPYDPRVVRQAVLRELDRGGQVFFVHNRVHSIHGVADRLERLLPEVRLAVAHGQMAEAELSQVMERFAGGEVDLLLSTSIIESGLDIQNANTLIVDRADTFGLAQLYQLRGRVGRGAVRGHAFLFRPSRERAGEEALRRLEILAEQTQLGAGFNIAMQDLELRGAGEILGTRQHGHIAAIGFHLYTRLLAAAVRRRRQSSEGPMPALEEWPGAGEPLGAEIDLPLPAMLPAGYIADRALRLRLYRRLAMLRRERELPELRRELEDRFGPPPGEVDNLLYLLRIKMLAAEAQVEGISIENGQILVHAPGAEQRYRPADLPGEVRRSKRGLWIARSGDWPERLEDLLRALGGSPTVV
jgi:transcription-repair coupling factor (superfamily II helicase)